MHFGNLANPFFTIGHSTQPIVVFVDLLGDAGVRLIVNVRTIPRSRTNPQYHRHVLTESLSAFEIGYEHIAGLGGLRGRKRDVPPAMNAFWENQSFHNYADHAMTEDFHSSLIRLRELGHAQQCAIMCAETVWWRCHRRMPKRAVCFRFLVGNDGHFYTDGMDRLLRNKRCGDLFIAHSRA